MGSCPPIWDCSAGFADLPLAEVCGSALILTSHRDVPFSEGRMVLPATQPQTSAQLIRATRWRFAAILAGVPIRRRFINIAFQSRRSRSGIWTWALPANSISIAAAAPKRIVTRRNPRGCRVLANRYPDPLRRRWISLITIVEKGRDKG